MMQRLLLSLVLLVLLVGQSASASEVDVKKAHLEQGDNSSQIEASPAFFINAWEGKERKGRRRFSHDYPDHDQSNLSKQTNLSYLCEKAFYFLVVPFFHFLA